MAVDSAVGVYHYSFLRRREAFFRCARVKQHIWTGSFDPRLEAAEKSDIDNWMTNSVVAEWINDLVEFKGTHPAVVHEWLRQRGYTP
jgi:hypothetical protein